MKTWKPTLEVLEGRETPSGMAGAIFERPDVDLPPPNFGMQTMVRPPSQPQSLSDIVSQAGANDKSGLTLTPGGTSSLFSQKSSNSHVPPAWGADWQPVTNIFQGQPGRATGGETGTAISVEFTGAGVFDPSTASWYITAPRDAATPVAVSVPDGGTVLLGGVKTAGQAHETVDNNEMMTIHGVAVDSLLAGTYGRGGAKAASDWASQVDTFFGQVGLQEKPSKGIIANGLEILGARAPAGASMIDGSVKGIQANPQNGIIAILIGG